VLIKAEHKRSRDRYGAPRIHAELRHQGRRHSRKRIARLMRQASLRGRAPKRWRKTTIPDPAAAARADAIRRDFTADASSLNAPASGLPGDRGVHGLVQRHRPHSTLGYRSPAGFEDDHDGKLRSVAERVISPVRQSGATPHTSYPWT
jgi:transposase InsO family protein